jgi:hypothetical protein
MVPTDLVTQRTRTILHTYAISRPSHTKKPKKPLNRSMASNKTESVIKSFPSKKALDQLASLLNSTKHLSYLKKMSEEGILQTPFMRPPLP